jgi:hypothetical protein
MDKPSEQKLSHKNKDDIDIGVHEYGIGNKRWQGNGLWDTADKEVVGLDKDRIATNDYKKEGKKGDKKEDLVDRIVEHGPPLLNVSKPRRVF